MTPEQRIQILEDRCDMLEMALGLNYDPPFDLGLTRYEARIVGVLLKAPIASYDRLVTALYAHTPDAPDWESIRVFITRARKKLASRGVDIKNTWGVGYWIPEGQKARLLDA